MKSVGGPAGVALGPGDPGAFDRAAAGYDARFTDSLLGRWLRGAVRERLDAAFRAGDRILELGCGTGEDAVQLASRGVRVTATDGSEAMLAVARRKAEAHDMTRLIDFARFDFAADPPGHPIGVAGRDDLAGLRSAGPFDGVFSNFGALNCLADRTALVEALAGMLRPGARVLLVLMGPICLWEIVWHLARGQPRRALRRFRPGQVAHAGEGATTRVWYPSPRRLQREFAPWFRHRETVGVGVLLPPSYLGPLVERRASAFERLRPLERPLAARFPWSALGDHYLSLFERR